MRKQIVLAIASFVCWCAPVTGQQQIRPGARTSSHRDARDRE